MDAKLFRSFTPYVNRAPRPIRLEDFSHLAGSEDVADPTGQQWVSGGFTFVNESEFVIDVQGAGILAMMKINERILPSSVIKEKMLDKIVQIEERDQRKANKSDYSQVKDEVIADLLPKAFVKRTHIPVLIVNGRHGQYCLVFTSSGKKADDVMLSLSVTLNEWAGKNAKSRWEPALLANCCTKDIASTLRHASRGHEIAGVEHDVPDTPSFGYYMTLHKSLVVKGNDKETVTIKEKDIGSKSIQDLLSSADYEVKKIGLEFYDGDVDAAASVTINDKLVCSGFKPAGVKRASDEEADEQFNNLYIVTRTASDMVSTLVDGLDGLRPVEETTDKSFNDPGVSNVESVAGLSAAQRAIIDDPMQQTDFDSAFGAVTVDDEEL